MKDPADEEKMLAISLIGIVVVLVLCVVAVIKATW